MGTELDQAYRERNELAAAVVALLPEANAWKGFDPAEPDWPVLYLVFPTGQVSYHFSPAAAHLIEHVRYSRDGELWDGHTQAERSIRLAQMRLS